MNEPAGNTLDDEPIPRHAPPRPLLLPAITLMLGIAAAEWLGTSAALMRGGAAAGLVAAVIGLFLAGRRRATTQVAMLTCLAAVFFTLGFARHQLAIARPPHHVAHLLANEPVLTRLAGRIVSTPIERPAEVRNPFLPAHPPPRTTCIIALESVHTVDPARAVTGRVRASIEAHGLGLRAGDRVQLTGRLYRPPPPRNPGEPDWTRWYRHQGLDAGLSIEGPAHVRRLPRPPDPSARALRSLRTSVQSLLFEPFADATDDPSVRLLDVMVLGQRSSADRALNDAFLRAGGMHFLAVSGFHVGVLAGFAWLLARHGLRLGRRGAAVAMLLTTLLYALVAEPNAPVLRAATMVVVASFGLMLLRPVNIVNWLAAAAIVVLLINPHELFRAGFQLSFVQVLALVLLVPPLHARVLRLREPAVELPREADTLGRYVLARLGRGLVGLALVCFVAYLVALPLVLFHFQRLAPWGWLGTLLLSPLVVITIVASFTTLLGGLVLPPLGALFGTILRSSTHALLGVVNLFERVPDAVIEVGRPPPGWLVAATYAALLWLATRPLRSRRTTAPAPPHRTILRPSYLLPAGALALLALGWLGWLVPLGGRTSDHYSVHVLAVGNGLATLVTTPDHTAAVFDAGTMTNADVGELAARALDTLGKPRLAHILISHANFDHFSGLPTLLRSEPDARWYTSAHFPLAADDESPLSRLRERLPPHHWPPDVLHDGNRLDLDGAFLTVLWPPDALPELWSANDRSLVVRLDAAGRRVLLTGDIEAHGLAALVARERAGDIDLSADVLIAPHHGAARAVTADFLAAVSPRILLVSSARHRPQLERLAVDVLGPAVQVVTTGEVGAVTVDLAPDGDPAVESARPPLRR